MRRTLLVLAALAAGLAGLIYLRRRPHPELESAGPDPEPPKAKPEPRAAEPASPAAESLLEALDPQPKQRILQLGLADDELTFAVAERVKRGKVEVLDSEQDAVDALAERARARGLRNVSGWHGDPKALLFEENRFDAAFVPGGAAGKAVMRELARVVKPGGRLVVDDGGSYVATLAEPDDG
jgi:SAM-dependent methyltransferase